MFRAPLLLLMAVAGLAFAQTPSSGGWRRVGDRPPAAQPPAPAAQPPANTAQAGGPAAPGQDPEPVDRSDAYGQPSQPSANVPTYDAPSADRSLDQQAPPAGNRSAYGLPPEVTVRPGTYLTVRLAQALSSDRNQPGDTFVATLAQPLVVDGIVVANRNQTVYGRVAEAEHAHADRPSRLGLELTSVTLADGTQVPIRSQLAARQGGTAPAGDQVGTVAATTVGGAVIGGIAGRGAGAAVGAGIGAMAGVIGVMMTRNRPTVVYPEAALTFAVQEPLTISTARAPQAFRYVGPEDYQGAPPVNAELRRRPAPGPYGYYAPYPYPYPYYYSPYPYYGFGFGVVIGPRYGYGHFRRW